MSIELLAFFFGILLLFVAIVGGGFEVRELKVPRVGRIARVISAVAGLLFLMLGFSGSTATELAGTPPAQAKEPTQETTTTAPTAVDFTVKDELGELQITEQITVHIDGRLVGTLTVDAVHPSSTVTVTVPKPGRYNYTLDSTTTFDLESGPTEIPGHGSGQIDVEAGASFAVFYDIGETQLDLELQAI